MTRYWCVSFLIAFACATGLVADQQQPQEELLSNHGIQPNAESLADYLRSLHPNDEARRKVAQLIHQLGSDSFRVREDATRELMRKIFVSRPLLVEATNTLDPEIRWRVRSILEQADDQREQLFLAALSVIESRKLEGLVGPILKAMPLFDKPHLHHATRRVLRIVAKAEDAPALKSGLLSEHESVKITSTHVLAKTSTEDTKELIRPLLSDSNEKVRLAANRAFADKGDRSCFQGLLSLLESDEVNIRSQSIYILRQLTGQQLGYVAYKDTNKRRTAIAAWKAWLDGEGQTAKLVHPLADSQPFLGRILVCNYSANYVTEYDVAGKTIWKKEDVNHPWGLDVLPNGHRLIVACNGKYVVEFDSTGEEVWRKDGLPGHPLSVQRLTNGNTLVSTGSLGKVIEIAPDGSIDWEVHIGGFIADARKLPEGLTLIAKYDSGEVIEVDREGKIVWRIDGFKETRSAQRLKNGNTLVCDTGKNRVVECDRDGNIVWKYEGLTVAYDCQRLPDGNTLIGDSTGLRLVSPAGKSLWHRPMKSTGRILAY